MPRYNTRNSGSTIPDSGSKILSSGSKIPDSGSIILDSKGSRKRRVAEDHGRRLGHVTPVIKSPECTLVPRVSITDILSIILSDETDDGDDDGTHQQCSVLLTPTSRKSRGKQQQQSDILRLAPLSSPLRVKTTKFQPSLPQPSSSPPPSPPPPSSSTSPPQSSSLPPSSPSSSSSPPSSPPSSSSLSSPSSPSSSASSSPVPVRRTKKVLPKPQTKAQKTKTTQTPKLPSRTQVLKTETGPSVSLACLPCRESEFQEILDFVETKLDTRSGGCMFISGVPGTGKTATIQAVLSYLVDKTRPGALTVVPINAMELTEPRQVYSKLLKAMSGERAVPSRAAQILNELFARRSKRSVLLILDELDLLVTRRQDLLYSLSDWATGGSSCLILLAIANTMDLPERVMLTRVSSRLGLTRMCFQPYSFQQLQEVARSHLSGVASFEPDALQLVARKVAALSGDARRMLDVCRRAAEIAAAEVKAASSISTSPSSPISSSANGRRAAGRSRDLARAAAVAANGKGPRVGLRQVGAALEETFRSPCVAATRECSSLEKFFLEAVLSEFSRTGLEETSFGQVFVSLRSLLLMSGHPPCSVSAALGSCSRLLSARLLLSSSTTGLRRRLRLNVPRADLLYGLRGGDSA
ncbi:origin recognition complex subunit 1 [Lampetra planeri]